MSKPRKNVVFKTYSQNQIFLIPPTFDELVDANHPVRTVSEVIDKLTLNPLLDTYKGGGTSSYHPRMLLKVLVYSYLSNIYSSRKIEAGIKENIHMMWLAGMTKPDHNTINRFRSERLKGIIKEVFSQVVMLLTESGHVGLQEVYTDGTKIESAANRYTFVWGKAIKTNKEKMAVQLEELWNYTQAVAKEELKDTAPTEFTTIDSEKVKQTVEKIEQALSGKQVDKKVKQKLGYIKKNFPANLEKYAKQEQILSGRNSYSKTDTDATFMRMKEDHMRNGQLKPGYNLQISTNKQFILHYSLHQSSTDTNTFISHLEQYRSLYKTLPKTITADAGYGSEENYQYLEQNNIEAFVKYNLFRKEQQEKKSGNKLLHDIEKDVFILPDGQVMNKTGVRIRRTATGYLQTLHRYQLQGDQTARFIEVNHNLERHKEKAREKLLSEKGIKHCKQRAHDVEPVFAAIKHNRGFKRYYLKGLQKVEIETGLLSIAHNLKKMLA